MSAFPVKRTTVTQLGKEQEAHAALRRKEPAESLRLAFQLFSSILSYFFVSRYNACVFDYPAR
jgi:hypothetical protein